MKNIVKMLFVLASILSVLMLSSCSNDPPASSSSITLEPESSESIVSETYVDEYCLYSEAEFIEAIKGQRENGTGQPPVSKADVERIDIKSITEYYRPTMSFGVAPELDRLIVEERLIVWCYVDARQEGEDDTWFFTEYRTDPPQSVMYLNDSVKEVEPGCIYDERSGLLYRKLEDGTYISIHAPSRLTLAKELDYETMKSYCQAEKVTVK